MEFFAVITKLALAGIIGAVIGLERESKDEQDSESNHKDTQNEVGVRTFSLLGLLGATAGLLYFDYMPLFILISTCLVIILMSNYILYSILAKDVGFTTELAILFSYLFGVFVATEIIPIQILLALSVVVTLILSRKSDIKGILKGIHREELNAFISYCLIALVILPFLPNSGFKLGSIPNIEPIVSAFGANIDRFKDLEIINPFKLWFIVVLITGIDIVGYALERLIGHRRGRLLASVVGGFISSTATTLALAQESKKTHRNVGYLVASAVFANTASFFQLFILIGVTNSLFLTQAMPLLLAIICTGIVMGLLYLREKHVVEDEIVKEIKGVKESEIFALGPALKFAALFFIVTIITRVALSLFGQVGFLIASSLAALTGIDAVTINIATLAGLSMSVQTSIFALILMNAVNLIAKCCYSFVQGSREFAIRFSIAVALIITSSLVGLLFV